LAMGLKKPILLLGLLAFLTTAVWFVVSNVSTTTLLLLLLALAATYVLLTRYTISAPFLINLVLVYIRAFFSMSMLWSEYCDQREFVAWLSVGSHLSSWSLCTHSRVGVAFNRTTADYFESAVRSAGSKPFLIFEKQTTTYQEADDTARAISTWAATAVCLSVHNSLHFSD
jgi:hypothetical protein